MGICKPSYPINSPLYENDLDSNLKIEIKGGGVSKMASCPAVLPLKETFFISHGSPTLSIDESLPARRFLKSFREKFMGQQKPNSILVISAHWETSEPTVNAIRGRHDTIHDFYGFPKSMYQVRDLTAVFFLKCDRLSVVLHRVVSSNTIVCFDY